MEVVTIDGVDEQDFRRSIEDMLRLDQVDAAVEGLRAMLETCVGVHEVLPPRFLEVSSRDVEFGGWHRLADRLLDHDRPGHKISAIGVTLADARALGGPGPSRGRLAPFIKTYYFTDDAYPFSDATRDDLLDGYSREGFEWQGDYQATDATLSIKGIDDLYGAIVELEDRLLDNPDPPAEDIRAGTIGACYLAALIHQSLRETIRTRGLPRPLCVLAACDGVYPFFDAPVAGSDEYMVDETAQASPQEAPCELRDEDSVDDEAEPTEDLPGMASLLSLVSHKGVKAPVIVLDEDDAREAVRLGEVAEAQRLVGDDEDAQKELLDGAHAARLAEAAALEDSAAWGDADLLDQQAELEDYAAIVTESLGRPLPDLAQDDPEPWDLSQLNERAAAAFIESPQAFPNILEHPIEMVAELGEAPFAAPASHSLRARIKLAEPDPHVTFADRVRSVLRSLRRLILRG